VAPSCTTTRSISHLLESGSVAFGTLTAYCAVAPEPTVSKFTMAALAVGTGATQLLKFVIDNIPCEQGGQSLSPEQRLEVETMICNQAGGKLVAGECFKPEWDFPYRRIRAASSWVFQSLRFILAQVSDLGQNSICYLEIPVRSHPCIFWDLLKVAMGRSFFEIRS